MVTLATVKEFCTRFEEIGNQSCEDWSAFEELAEKKQTFCMSAVALALDSCIVSEIRRAFDDKKYVQATYVRDLAQLLVDLRKAML